jgi:hypothetical protein
VILFTGMTCQSCPNMYYFCTRPECAFEKCEVNPGLEAIHRLFITACTLVKCENLEKKRSIDLK